MIISLMMIAILHELLKHETKWPRIGGYSFIVAIVRVSARNGTQSSSSDDISTAIISFNTNYVVLECMISGAYRTQEVHFLVLQSSQASYPYTD